MSDNWAMDLAREEQVYSEDCAAAEWPEDTSLSPPSSVEDYMEQGSSLKVQGSVTDDGYVSSASCSNSANSSEVSEADRRDKKLNRKDDDTKRNVRRLSKNQKQRERERSKKAYITELKRLILASDLIQVKPRGRKLFTEYNTLRYTRQLIEALIIMRDRRLHSARF